MPTPGPVLNNGVEILVAEDSPTQAEQLKHLLEARGYAVRVASNGKLALAAARESKPALVISDILMPEMDGYQLCNAIKADENLKNIPVILVTSLSSPQDVIKGLECGADSFIRKPYNEKYLLSRLDYLRANRALRQQEQSQMGLEIALGGQRHFITSERQQILDLLISTYEEAIRLNEGLQRSNQSLNGLYRIAEGLNRAGSEDEVCEMALERAMELPGVQAGWIFLREGESGYRPGAAHGLPPALGVPGALEGECLCRRKLLAGELEHVTNILECERLQEAKGDTRGLRYHASVPLWVGDQMLGLMNLVGAEEGLFSDEDLKILYGVGNQVGIALERARLREHLEELVEERTAALRESELWFRAVFDSQEDAVIVLSPDRVVANMNAAAERMFGYSVEEVKNQSTEVFHVDHMHYLRFGEHIHEAFSKGEAARFEFELKRKNGEVYPTDHTVALLKDERGEAKGIVSVVRDITERKQAEAASREQAERFRTMMSTITEGFWLVDDKGRLLDVNEAYCRMSAYSKEELLTLSIPDLEAAETMEETARHIQTIIESGSALFESKHKTKDGRIFDVEISVAFWPEKRQFFVFIQDISDRKQAEEEIQRQLRRITALRAIDMAITSSSDLHLTLGVVLDHVTAQLGVDAAAVLLLDPHLQTLDYAAGRGFRTDALQHTRLRLGEGYAGRAALERQLIHIPDLRGRTTDFLRSPKFSAEGFMAYYVVPLIAKGHVRGVLEVFHRGPLDPDPEWQDFLETLAGQAAVAVDNAALFDGLQRSNVELTLAYDATIAGWSRAMDLRDKETEGHTQRVTEMTERLARAMGISEAELVHIRRGALLHDMGKMGIPDSILLKPGKLTDDEWVLMRKHPAYAFEMLSPIVYLQKALDIPYCHHEKWDGSGYPRGLKGEAIPLAARIFAVADVWDALRSDRPYRAAWPEERVLAYIQEQAGSHFDLAVVKAFLQVFEQD